MNNYSENLSKLSDTKRIRFYEGFAHHLTVINRAIWSDETIDDHEKVDQMKWTNEIMHTITQKISKLRTGKNKWSDDETFIDIKHWISQNENINDRIEWIITNIFSHLDDNQLKQ